MRRKLSVPALLCVALACISCTTNFWETAAYSRVEISAHLGPVRDAAHTGNAATIVIHRERTIDRSRLRACLSLDGDPLVELAPGEFARFRVLPGRYVVTLQALFMLGSAQALGEEELLIDCRPRETCHIAVSPRSGSGLQLRRVR